MKDIHARLGLIEASGWDSSVGRELLAEVRVDVVRPVVRRSGLRGPAADQAEASAWAAAWDALRRPSARAADNPMGMAWVAAKRAVLAEMSVGAPSREELRRAPAHLSVDDLIAGGWNPPADALRVDQVPLGSIAEAIVAALADAGWSREVAEEAVRLLAERAEVGAEGAVAPWRGMADSLGIAQWRMRRLASLVLGGPGLAGLVELVVWHGTGILNDPVLEGAIHSTTRRSRPSPESALREWCDLGARVGAGSPPAEVGRCA